MQSYNFSMKDEKQKNKKQTESSGWTKNSLLP